MEKSTPSCSAQPCEYWQSGESFGRYRGHFLVGSLIFAAILTPPDPYTQVMMAGPMAVLYELGILLAKLAARRARSSEVVEAGA